jgi:hypothetical protein
MKTRLPKYSFVLVAAIFFGCTTPKNTDTNTNTGIEDAPAVTAPPPAFFQKFSERDRATAEQFYKKYLDLNGVSIAAAGEVSDAALQRTYYLVSHILAGRPDVLHAMADKKIVRAHV